MVKKMKQIDTKIKVIIGVGSVSVLILLILTIIACKGSVNHFNQTADTAYAQAVSDAKNNIQQLKQQSIVSSNMGQYDVVTIDDEPYIYLPTDDDSMNSNDSVAIIVVDTNNTQVVDGKEYVHVETPETLDDAIIEDDAVDNNSQEDEYVVVSVDDDDVYLIKKGDTLSEISGMVHYSVDEIAEYNHIKNVDLIYAGESLRIPNK
jgi:LysM repeat protein